MGNLLICEDESKGRLIINNFYHNKINNVESVTDFNKQLDVFI